MTQYTDILDGSLPLTHTFSEGVYAREIFMPKGMIVAGHIHTTTHLNIVSLGKAKVWMSDTKEIIEVVAPYTFESKAGVRKVLFIEEDMFWTTIHLTDLTDVEEIENAVLDKKASENLELEDLRVNMKLLTGGQTK